MNTEYKKLISEAKSYYEGRPDELRNIKNGNVVFDLIWYKGLSNEINLWSYWQGAGVDHPEVMIVGQDFGSCKGELFEQCVKSYAGDGKILSEKYITEIHKNKKNKTDNMLLELTEKGLGKKYSARTPGNENLFMTNLCLGYRTGDKMSGGDLNPFLKHDSLYISKLIELKRPKVVICIGKDTFFNLGYAFPELKDSILAIKKNFWKSLDEGRNYVDSTAWGFRMYGVAHTGSFGTMNRRKYCTIKDAEKYTGMGLMLNDWKRIGKYLVKS